MSETPKPTPEELDLHNLRTFKGIEVGLGEADPVAAIAQKLEAQHPGHLILVQSGNFLHGFDRTAYALSILKSYKLKLIGAATEPHLRVGFPVGNFKRRLWTVVEEFGIPYVVALGTLASGRTIYTSAQPTGHLLDLHWPAATQRNTSGMVAGRFAQESGVDTSGPGESRKADRHPAIR